MTLDRFLQALRAPSGWLLGAIFAAWLFAVARAPIDSVQGVIQKILYVHPPLAFAAYLGFALTAISGLLFLWRGHESYDRLANHLSVAA